MVKDDFSISKMIQMSICSGLRGWPGALVAFQASHGIVLEPSNSGPTTVNNTLTVVASIPFFHFTSLLKMHPNPLHWGWNWAPAVLNILRPCLVGCWWDVDFAFSLLWRGAYSTLNHSCGGDIIPNLSGFESSCYTTKQPQWTPRTFSPLTVFFVGAGYHATLQLLFSRNFR